MDKEKIKEQLTQDNIYELLNEWGGEPKKTNNGIISKTICHNGSSHKLYYYNDSKLFHCFTGGCEEPTFDIFDLVIKIMRLQYNQDFTLYNAISWLANKFNIEAAPTPTYRTNSKLNEIITNYQRLDSLEYNSIEKIVLPEYDASILDKFDYNVVIQPWIDDKITSEVMKYNHIGYYAGRQQITIPHFDIDNRLIGIRGRSMATEDIELYGKYRPLFVNRQLYNHPLGMNLYNLNNSKNNIQRMRKAIIFESEKATMRYQTEFGFDNDLSVASCGSSLTSYQVYLLRQLGVQEIIIAFDRDFEEIGDERFVQMKRNCIRLYNKYKNQVLISFIFDKDKITSIKSSPIDENKDNFLYLFKHRITL